VADPSFAVSSRLRFLFWNKIAIVDGDLDGLPPAGS
jgi:hypothetical protein